MVETLKKEFIACVIGQIKGKHHDISEEEVRRDIEKVNEQLEKKHIMPSVDLFVKKLDEMHKSR